MDNEKLFELITKMYSDMNTRFDKIEDKFNNRFDVLENKVDLNTNRITALEDKVDKSTKILFDGYTQTYEKLTELEGTVKDLSEKVESQDVKIEVIKGNRKRA